MTVQFGRLSAEPTINPIGAVYGVLGEQQADPEHGIPKSQTLYGYYNPCTSGEERFNLSPENPTQQMSLVGHPDRKPWLNLTYYDCSLRLDDPDRRINDPALRETVKDALAMWRNARDTHQRRLDTQA